MNVMSDENKLINVDEVYIKQMDSWLKEQLAMEKQIRVTIETSSEIVRQNEIQLKWHLTRYEPAISEYNEWRQDKGLPPIKI